MVAHSKHKIFTEDVIKRAYELLLPIEQKLRGDVHEHIQWPGQKVSEYLCDFLESQLAKDPLWLKAHPILLGSWARRELCLSSDLDVIFLGPEDVVANFVRSCLEKGIKLRSRVPVDLSDWTVNVETPDVIALYQGRALTEFGKNELKIQQDKIFQNKRTLSKLVTDAFKDRKNRAERYDSISSFLEPNIKHGAGGLRDLQQGSFFRSVFESKFSETDYELKVLSYYSGFFHSVRHYLHFDNLGDVLTGTEQHSLFPYFGFDSQKEFMRQIERGIARVSFYSDWILEEVKSTEKTLKKYDKVKLKSPEDLYKALSKDSGMLMQYQVRRALDPVFDPKKVSAKILGKILKNVLDIKTKDTVIHAVFRSRLIDKIQPRITRLVGYVQHDQYHRFTADAHILQACREMKRLYKKPKDLEALQKFAKKLKPKDWEILSWSALYHDLAKGIDSEDHSVLGEKWVKEDLKSYGFSKDFITEVSWLVKNHLELSVAAFRKNPQSKQTWQDLFDLGLNDQRLLRLAVFTACDIRATNPEAWNSWKSRLLSQLVQTLLDGKTQNYLTAIQKIPKNVKSAWVEILDPEVFSSFSSQILLKDLASLAGKKQESVKVFKDKNQRLWIRFYDPVDKKGILFEYVQRLFSSGFQIQNALIHTLPEFGVYDWIQVSSQKSPQSIEKMLAHSSPQSTSSLKPPSFQSVTLVSESETEWVVSFKALDQKGLLLTAVRSLTAQNAEIISARVHTWGRQVDDLFSIRPLSGGSKNFVSQLEKMLGV